MGAPFLQFWKLFDKKQNTTDIKSGKTHHVRTLTSPESWTAFVDAINSYNGTGSSLNALKVSAVFACNDRLSKDVASLPFRPTRKKSNGNEIATDHPLFALLQRPSKFLTPYMFNYRINSDMNLFGEAFAVINRKNGSPVSFTLWHPCDVEHDLQGDNLYWIHKKAKVVVNDEDMIHPMWFTEDGIRGKSGLHYAKNTLDLALNGSKLSSELYKNQMWQPGYISYKTDLDQGAADMISTSWAGNYMGEENKMNIPILDNGSEWKQFGMSLKESEYSQTIERTIVDICRYFGLPPSKLGVRDGNVSYNSLEQENIAYVQDSLVPRAVSIEQEFERKLIADAELGTVRIKYELKGRLRGDMAARSAFYDMALRNGLLSINDTLRLEDMDTIGPEGDERYVNGAQVPLSKLFSGELNEEPKKEDDEIDELVKNITKNGHATKILQHKS